MNSSNLLLFIIAGVIGCFHVPVYIYLSIILDNCPRAMAITIALYTISLFFCLLFFQFTTPKQTKEVP